MKKDYKGIIFDLDGVICYTDQYHYKAWKMLADKLGIPFDEQINNRLRGVSRMESLEIILEKSEKAYTEEEKVEMAEEKNTNYRELLAQMSPKDLSSEVKETLDLLHGTKLLAIGSSSKNTAGSRTMARPSATRCLCPPDSSFGFRLRYSSSPRIRAASRTFRSISSFGVLRISRANAIFL